MPFTEICHLSGQTAEGSMNLRRLCLKPKVFGKQPGLLLLRFGEERSTI